jgi:hypothetical protein
VSGAKDDIEWRLDGIFCYRSASIGEGRFPVFVGILDAKGIEQRA